MYEGHDSGIHCLTSEAGAETKLFPTWLTLNNRPVLNQNQATTLDSSDVPENTPKLMSEPSGQFQQTETPLSVWMSGSLMPLSNENQPQLGRCSLESNQPNISEVDKNICCELASGAANKESMASVSPQVSPFSRDCGHYITITTPSLLPLQTSILSSFSSSDSCIMAISHSRKSCHSTVYISFAFQPHYTDNCYFPHQCLSASLHFHLHLFSGHHPYILRPGLSRHPPESMGEHSVPFFYIALLGNYKNIRYLLINMYGMAND